MERRTRQILHFLVSIDERKKKIFQIGDLAYQIRETAKHPAFDLGKDNWQSLYNLCVQLVRLINTFEFNSINSRGLSQLNQYTNFPQAIQRQENNQRNPNPYTSSNSPPVTRCCQMCFVTESPVWRSGPNGQKTLCNACGLYYSKRQRHLKLQRELKEKSNSPPDSNNNSVLPSKSDIPTE